MFGGLGLTCAAVVLVHPRPIWLVRQPKLPLESLWRAARHID